MLHLPTASVVLAASGLCCGIVVGDPTPHEWCEVVPERAQAATAVMPPMPGAWFGLDAPVAQVNLDADGMNILGDAANEPSIAVDPTAPNRMAIGWRQFDSIGSSFREAGYSFSVDGGRTWSPKQEIATGVFRSDPVLRSTPEGVFLYSSLQVDGDFSVLFHRSFDGGQTWTDGAFAFGGDKQWFSLGAGGAIFHHWTSSANRSLDGGQTWSDPVSFFAQSGANIEPILGESTVGPDGAYYIAGLVGSGVLGVVRSDDPAGPEFSFQRGSVVPMDGDFSIGFALNPAGALSIPTIAVNPSDGPFGGEVYFACAVEPSGLPGDMGDLEFNRSTDRGATWLPSSIKINDDNGGATQWFGTMSIAPNGRIDIVWLDTREDPVPTDFIYLSALFHSSSEDGGRTWTQNRQLSEIFDSRLGWPRQNKMGDYFNMVSDNLGADLAWCATFEGEQNVYYTRIGDRDCDGNQIADAADIASGAVPDCDGDGIPDSCEIAAGDAPSCALCPADFAVPFGTLDLADIVAFVTAFSAGDGRADLAAPPGVFDLSDVSAFVTAFVAGCP